VILKLAVSLDGKIAPAKKENEKPAEQTKENKTEKKCQKKILP